MKRVSFEYWLAEKKTNSVDLGVYVNQLSFPRTYIHIRLVLDWYSPPANLIRNHLPANHYATFRLVRLSAVTARRMTPAVIFYCEVESNLIDHGFPPSDGPE